MSNGIYIVANDKYYEEAVACINSIRLYDPLIPIICIPYDESFQLMYGFCSRNKIGIFEDIRLLRNIERNVRKYLPHIRHPARLRNLACWLGPFKQFIYMDADIVVFEKIAEIMDWLDTYDLVHSDNQYHTGIRWVFNDCVPLSKEKRNNVFNCGMWASKSSLLNAQMIIRLLKQCGEHTEYFCKENGVSAQPIINWLALSSNWNIANLNKIAGFPPSWAGNPAFNRKGFTLYYGTQPLKYLHWAGRDVKNNYNFTWKFFRELS